MSEINILVPTGYLALGEISLSGIRAGQSKLRGGRWTASNLHVFADVRPTAVDCELPKPTLINAAQLDAALMSGVPTDVPTTGAPPSVVRRT